MNKIIDLIIKYQNSSGDVTERRISDIIPEGLDSINAFCHLRQERRTFEYLGLLKEIPHSVMDQCQRVALLIAKGSGRKPIPPELMRGNPLEFMEELAKEKKKEDPG